MRDIDKLCETLNNRVFDYNALIVDYSDSIPVIKVCPRMSAKLVKKLHFDDLITYHNGQALMTLRLQNYAIELSKGEIVVTRKILFY